MSEPRPPYTRERVVELLAEADRRLQDPDTTEDERLDLYYWRKELSGCLARWDKDGGIAIQLYEYRMGLYWMRRAMDLEHEDPDSLVLSWAWQILVNQERTDTRPDDAPVLGLYY